MTLTLVASLTVPARGAEAFPVAAGQRMSITDPEGGQVGDLFVHRADDPAEHLSAAHTRAATARLFPAIGEQFVTTRRRPILTLVEDTSAGRHDMLIPACDPERYRALGAPGHASCARNLVDALARHGVRTGTVPQPVNVFMDVRQDAGGLTWHPASTRPGDTITFQAVMDCLVVLSACPQDLAPVNSGPPTPLSVTVFSADSAAPVGG
ncbi:urea carboxylase-associated family protein [Streptomyces capparidis]